MTGVHTAMPEARARTPNGLSSGRKIPCCPMRTIRFMQFITSIVQRHGMPAFVLVGCLGLSPTLTADPPPSIAELSANTWVKLSPLDGGPPSPRLGYEGACVWDRRHRLLVRYGGHNQGGGGEQGAEVWTFDPLTAKWELKEPNTSPPGVCCNAQNVYDPVRARYVRFPLFSGSHGWQWWREIYLNDSTVWAYDLAANRWRNLRPIPTPKLAPYRAASWDSRAGKIVVFGGEGSHEGTIVYDPARNEWRDMNPDPEPPPRSGGTMAYDEARDVHVLFGTQFGEDARTWTYNLSANQWTDQKPPVQPPTRENDAVLTYDPVNKVVIAIVKVTTGEDESATHEIQTWAYDAGANRWQRRQPSVEPDRAGNRTRNLVFAPELNAALLENCPSEPREQQVWAYRYAAAPPDAVAPLPPTRPPLFVQDAAVSVMTAERVEIVWEPSAAEEIAGYHVERAAVDVWTEDQLRRLRDQTPPLAEPSVGAIRRIGTFVRLTDTPVAENSFVDTSVRLDQPAAVEGEPIYETRLHLEHLAPSGKPYRFAVYAYRLVSVDAGGESLGMSPVCFTIPSSPQYVFSREDEEACRLRWKPNPEKGIRGYRVYRMDGRYNKDPITRLTREPISETSAMDAEAGESARRYYIIAVDALGQEGFPSSPVWYRREWRKYYEPFIDEWHQ